MNIQKLERALECSWGRDTCYEGDRDEWCENNPAKGQCAITAMIVQDHLGGEIIRCVPWEGYSHYYNLIDGERIDLTASQFKKGFEIPEGEIVDRSRLEPSRRYEILKVRVNYNLGF